MADSQQNSGENLTRAGARIISTRTNQNGKIVRLVIQCTYPGCSEQREIAVQDAFQVKYCLKHAGRHKDTKPVITVQIRLPESVLRQAKALADKDHISLEYFVALAVAERVAALRAMAFLDQRAEHGSPAQLKKILGRAPDVEPEPMDRITP